MTPERLLDSQNMFPMEFVKTAELIKVTRLSTCLTIAMCRIRIWSGTAIILADVCLSVDHVVFLLVSSDHCKLPQSYHLTPKGICNPDIISLA
jgi:hypothetical protein